MGGATTPQIDHINGDGLDNRRSNLRAATASQNAVNRPMQRNNTSGIAGARKMPWGKWRATVKYKGKQISLGMFLTADEAREARASALRRLFGEFARTP